MLILTINIGKERYGIEAIQVIEVIPLVVLQSVPLADQSIRGLFNYRGAPTPVVDLCQVFEQRACSNKLSSRIIIICPKALSGTPRPIGLVAESVTEVLQCEIDELASSGISSAENSCLGLIYKHGDELIQIIDTNHVLPESIASQLFSETGLEQKQA
ncbi:MAG: chemotaxis protein CheW [Gammaproteobacteria bacterium]|nr:chemotaxis protein CheW [Gammaproteobacteria bacterium]